MGLPQAYFFLSKMSHPLIYMLCVSVCYGVSFMFSGSHAVAMFTNGGSTVGVCNSVTPWSIHLAGMFLLVMVHARSALSCCFLHCFEKGELHATLSAAPSHFINMGGIHHWGLDRESLDPFAFPILWGQCSFPGSAPSCDIVNYKPLLGVKPGDSGVMIGYQVNEFTHNWCFTAQWNIYPLSQARCQH